MKGIVRRRGAAQRDLIETYRYYAREAGIRTADRFLAAANDVFQRLANMPGMGKRYDHEHPALAELRFFPLSSRFKVYIVFYRPIDGGIEIARVLHGARDIDSILAEDFGITDTDDESEGPDVG